MTTLILKTTRSQYGSPFDDKNDYVVLRDGHVIGRIFMPPQAPERQPWFWTITAREYLADDPQSRLFNDTPTSDDGIQSAVAKFSLIAKGQTRESIVFSSGPSDQQLCKRSTMSAVFSGRRVH